MPKVARYGDKEFIVGPGLDEVLSPEKRLVLLDDEFGDMYGDYIFLGYDVLAESIDTGRADLVGIYSAYLLISSGKTLTVCGRNPLPCTLGLAAYIAVERGLAVEDSIRLAWRSLKELYGNESIAVPRPALAALDALIRSLRLLGEQVFSTVFSLASSYEYGYGRISYGETITWINNLGASDNALLTALLSFLALSLHGAPAEILKYRLEAVGEASLISLIGPRAERIIATLKSFAERGRDEDAALLQLVVHLGPGTESTLYVDKEGSYVRVFCAGSEPTKECMSKIQQADRVLHEMLGNKFSGIRLVLGGPGHIVVSG